ncbi:SPOSA6832_02030, partial [Sporobolomyces salmonicolor]
MSTAKIDLFGAATEHPTLALLCSAFASLLTYVVYSCFFHPLADVPGPLSIRLGLGSWMTTRALKRDMGWKLEALHNEYGPVVRCARNMVSLVDPSAITEIYRYGAPYDKAPFYSFFKVTSPALMSTLPTHDHAEARRSVSPAFAMTLLVALEELVTSCLDDLCGFVDKAIASSSSGAATVDIGTLLQLLAIDVVGELAFGHTFGALPRLSGIASSSCFSSLAGLAAAGRDKDSLIPMLDAYSSSACLSDSNPFRLSSSLTSESVFIAGTQPYAKPFLHWCMTRQVGAEGPNALGKKAGEAVAKRLEQMREAATTGDEPRRDMLSKLVQAKNPDGSPFSVAQVKVQANSILGELSPRPLVMFVRLTTMRAVLYYIHRDPAVLDKVLAEIDSALADGSLTFPVLYADGTKLSYFQVLRSDTVSSPLRAACLKETLRLHPAVPWTLPRVVPKEGAVIAGHYFAAGTEVGMSPYVFHRRKEAYGDDATSFRPERWLDASEEDKKVLERNLISFGSGSRVCIGKNISLMEITKVVPTLLYKYKLRFTPRSASSPHQLPGRAVDGAADARVPFHVKSQWFAHQHDFWMDVEERRFE